MIIKLLPKLFGGRLLWLVLTGLSTANLIANGTDHDNVRSHQFSQKEKTHKAYALEKASTTEGIDHQEDFIFEICNSGDSRLLISSMGMLANVITATNDDNNTLVDVPVSGNVLINDLDNEGEAFQVVIDPHVPPKNGTVILDSNGDYNYIPSPNFVGQDQFEYLVCGLNLPLVCDTGTVIINVSHPPAFSNNVVIANNDEAITDMGTPVTNNVTGNDADLDGGRLTINTTPIVGTTNGTLNLMSNGYYTYVPAPGFAGQDQFVYEICDEGLPVACAQATAVINVVPGWTGHTTNAPIAGDDFNVTPLNELVTGDLSMNDIGDLVYSGYLASEPLHGSASVNPDGTYSYFPDLDYAGPDQFVYTTCSPGPTLITNYFSSTDVPMAVQDAAHISKMQVNYGGAINDINITNLQIDHAWMGDLTLTLISPAGTQVVFYADMCSNQVGGYNLTVDESGTDINTCSDFMDGKVHKPLSGSLLDFVGESSVGEWQLMIQDGTPGNWGTLKSWGLEIKTHVPVCTDATAYFLVLPKRGEDIDEDNDGISDLEEVYIGDHDNDGIPDYKDPDFCTAVFQGVNGWSCANGLPDPDYDLDQDGVHNLQDPQFPYTIPDTDNEGYFDYLDLDSDNDGIPDLIEVGGVDADGNGLVDLVADSDFDGLVDMYDPVNSLNPGTNEGTLLEPINSDSDATPDYLDLDSDNDGILDLIEVGGIDLNNDGKMEGNVGDNGYNNSLDPKYGGMPFFTVEEDAAGDLDNRREFISSNKEVDLDEDDVPGYLDVDSDNDGIYDIYEGQPTLDYTPPVELDSDKDGIDDAYDADALATYNGVNPNNHDETDLPDYLDLDTDNDNIPDWQEAWDHLWDGDSRPDNITGTSGEDSDGDGLLDVFDSDDTDPTVFSWGGRPADDFAGSNGSAAGVLFVDNLLVLLPENGGDNANEPDFRDQLTNCTTPLAYYALTEMGGSTNSYSYNKATGLHEMNANTGVVRATAYCFRDGWFYYYNPLQPTNYLFAMKYNAEDAGIMPINELVDFIEIRLDNNPSGRYKVDSENAQMVMPRDWHVVLKETPELGAKYDIKFYFDPLELRNLDIAADAIESGYNTRELKWFKSNQGDGVSFDPKDITSTGIANMEDITALAAGQIDENTGLGFSDGLENVDPGNGKNHVSFIGLPGFSGGTALISMSMALPVELKGFQAQENGCQIDLSWVTQSEEGFSHFEVERSDNGKDFYEIKVIESLSDNSGNAYFIEDESVRGKHFYRLKIVDMDGSFSYSDVVSASIDCGSNPDRPIEIYPNPLQGDQAMLHIACESPRDNPTFYILDLMGRVVKSKSLDLEKGWVKTSMEVGDLAPGTYFLMSRDVGIEFGKKFLKME